MNSIIKRYLFKKTFKDLKLQIGEGDTFEDIQVIISQPSVINKIKEILVHIHCPDINSRLFLSCYIIKYCNKELALHDYPQLILYSQKCIHYFERIRTCPEFLQLHLFLFIHNLQKYNTCYNAWKIKDLENTKKQLLYCFWELEHTKETLKLSNEYVHILPDIEEEQRNIKVELSHISPDVEKEIENYSPTSEQVKFKQNIEDVAKKAYWDCVKEDLFKVPPVFDRIIIMIQEIKERLMILIPNNKEYLENMNEHIDTDFIKQQLDNSCFSHEDIYKLIMYIIEKIKEFIAPCDDEDHKNWKTHTEEQFKDQPITIILLDFFKSAFYFIEKIEDGVKEFHKNLKKEME